MAVAPDAKSVALIASGSAVTTFTISAGNANNITVGSGLTGGVLLVALCFDHDLVTSPTATWGGTSMSNLGTVSDGANTQLILFGLRNPAAGNLAIVLNWTTAAQVMVYSRSYSGADVTSDATAFKNFNSAHPAASSTPSVTITSAVGDYVFGFFENNSAAVDVSSIDGGTGLWLSTGVNNSNNAGDEKVGAAGSVTISGVLSASDSWAACGIDIGATAAAVVDTAGSSIVRPRLTLGWRWRRKCPSMISSVRRLRMVRVGRKRLMRLEKRLLRVKRSA